MFRRTKCRFAGESVTVLIALLTYFLLFGSKTFANSATRTLLFCESALVLVVLMCCFPILVWVGWCPISYLRLRPTGWYLPPVGFLLMRPRWMTTIPCDLLRWFIKLLALRQLRDMRAGKRALRTCACIVPSAARWNPKHNCTAQTRVSLFGEVVRK